MGINLSIGETCVMRFLETLFRHRLLALLPLLIGISVAMGYESTQPRQYTATASLWVDASLPGSSPSSAYTDPSVLVQSQLQELLATRAFALQVGDQGPLAQYLASHPKAEATGLAAVPGIGSFFAGASLSIDTRVATDLPTMVTVVTAGPQVVNLNTTGPTSAVAAGTDQALIQAYSAHLVSTLKASDQLSVTYYDQQVTQAELTLQTAQASLSTYLAANPSVPATGVGDATATELVQAASLDSTTYQSVLALYQQAQLALANVNTQLGFEVLDPATPSPGAVSITKKLLAAGVVGLVVGLLVSVLMITALTASDRTARRADDIRRYLGLEVAGSIERIPGGVEPTRVIEA
jgi:uncharacterized protein involved in exopolysaccharide biosynthesis